MRKEKKILLTIVVDIILIMVLIFSVYMLLFHSRETWKKNLYTALVVFSIPTIFYITFTNVTADKFNYDIDESEDSMNDDSQNEQEDIKEE